ncbi:unnamed protein product [Choristocarpus tenellus]
MVLRTVFSVGRGRLAVAFQEGTVVEVGCPDHSRKPVVTLFDEGNASEAIDLSYSEDASLLGLATEDRRIAIWKVGVEGTSPNGEEVALIGSREVPKKPTRIRFGEVGQKDVILISDKRGYVYAAPLPNPAAGLAHLLGHTSMTITTMELLGGGGLLATGDRVEHIRVSEFPRTSIVHSYLLGHTDFVSALATVPGHDSLLLSGGADGMIGLWDVHTGTRYRQWHKAGGL